MSRKKRRIYEKIRGATRSSGAQGDKSLGQWNLIGSTLQDEKVNHEVPSEGRGRDVGRNKVPLKKNETFTDDRPEQKKSRELKCRTSAPEIIRGVHQYRKKELFSRTNRKRYYKKRGGGGSDLTTPLQEDEVELQYQARRGRAQLEKGEKEDKNLLLGRGRRGRHPPEERKNPCSGRRKKRGDSSARQKN